MARQKKLFSLKTALKDRLGSDFIKGVPKSPGVYYFYGEDRCLLYIGKAKNLKNRLSSYFRIDQSSPKKLQRLSMLSRSIEWEVLESEKEALLRENYLLRSFKPPFNRMNVRPESYLYIFFSSTASSFEIRVSNGPDRLGAEERFGCFKGRRRTLESIKAILRIFWFLKLGKEATALQRPFSTKRSVYRAGVSELPPDARSLVPWLKRFLKGTSQSFLVKAHEALSQKFRENCFESYLIEQDIDLLEDFFRYGPYRIKSLVKTLDFSSHEIEQDKIDDAIVRQRFPS